MVRQYVPTGRPRGRPKGIPKVVRPPVEIGKAVIEVDPAQEAGDQMRDALHQMMAYLHTQLPIVVQAVAAKRPETVLQFYKDMAEFIMPKLARNEQVGTVMHEHQHFVAVEEREKDPRLAAQAGDPRLASPEPITLLPQPDGSFASNEQADSSAAESHEGDSVRPSVEESVPDRGCEPCA